MHVFCPACDDQVEVTDTVAARCPVCHRRFASDELIEPEDMASNGPRSGAVRPVVLGAVVVAVIAIALITWLMVDGNDRSSKAADPAAAGAVNAPLAGDWLSLFARAGHKTDKARPPGGVDPGLLKAATGLASDEALTGFLKERKGAGRLAQVPNDRRRDHPVIATEALWRSIEAGKAAPVHAIEAAWLSMAAARARGLEAQFVVDRSGVQTPLLLARTRVAVRTSAGQLLNPLGVEIGKAEVVSDRLMALWWVLLRAHASRSGGDFASTHADLALAARIEPDEAAIQFARGVVTMDQGLLDKGLETCEAALAKRDDGLARLFLADVLAAMQKPFKASGHVDKALKAPNPLPEAWVSKGLLQAGRVATLPEAQKAAALDEAVKSFEKALSLLPSVPGARAGLAQVRLLQQDQTAAEKLLREAVQTYGDVDAALLLVELLQGTKRGAEVAPMLRKLDRLDDERLVQSLARALVLQGDKKGALDVAEEAWKRQPANRAHALLRADLLRQVGRVGDAITALEPLRTGEDSERMTLLQAQLYLQDDKVATAIERLESLSKGASPTREVLLLLLVARVQAGDATALNKFTKRLLDNGLLTELDVAGVFLETGDAERAQTVLEQAVAKPAPAQEAAVMLAMVYVASGRKKDALALRERMVTAAGAGGAALGTKIDEAIASAEQEMESIAREEAAGGANLGEEPEAAAP